MRPAYKVSANGRRAKIARSLVFLLLASNVLVACEGRDKGEAHEAVKAMLKDPTSARFSDEEIRKDAICGWYNAKNGYGGYGESYRYVYDLKTKRAHLFVDPNAINSTAGFDAMDRTIAVYRSHCLG